MSDEPAPPVSDEELLARFKASKNRPKGSDTLGFEMIAVDQAGMRVEAHFQVDDNFTNPMGQVQGGFVCAMLDDVMSLAGVVTSGMTAVMPTLEMKTSFLRPALPNQKLRAIGRVVKWGRTIAFTEGEIYDPEGKLLAKASGTAMPAPYAKYKK